MIGGYLTFQGIDGRATESGDPFLVVRECGRGRTASFASDCAPHWGSSEFHDWEHYGRFWVQLTDRLTRER